MIRFFADPHDIGEKSIILTAEDSAHIRSLRLRPNEQFVVCNGHGIDYVCCLSERQPSDKANDERSVAKTSDKANANDERSVAKIVSQKKSIPEPSVRCTVFIAYAKGERLDYAVQKSVELGAASIALFASERCIAKPNDISAKIERLQRIALEAAKQSGRGVIPEVSAIKDLSAVISATNKYDLTMLFYEDESKLHIMTVLEHFFPLITQINEPRDRVRSIAIITGPEGGFDPSEVDLAKMRDIPIVTLGSRILRSETAPVVALSAIMYHTGNL